MAALFLFSSIGRRGSGLRVADYRAVHDGGGSRGTRLLPDPSRTPGAINPAVTQANIDETICVRGWTRTVHPPLEFTYQLKRQQLREWGCQDRRFLDYEEDHLAALSLGGTPDDPRNLWPESWVSPDGWGADRKGEMEAVAESAGLFRPGGAGGGAGGDRDRLDCGLSAK